MFQHILIHILDNPKEANEQTARRFDAQTILTVLKSSKLKHTSRIYFPQHAYKLQWQSITHAHWYPGIIVCTANVLKQLVPFGEPEGVDSDATVNSPQLTTKDPNKAYRSRYLS